MPLWHWRRRRSSSRRNSTAKISCASKPTCRSWCGKTTASSCARKISSPAAGRIFFIFTIKTQGGVNVSAGNWGKFYHGDLIERAILLLFALCGHIGRKGASFSAFPALHPDTALGALERRGHQMLQSAASNDPRYSAWKEDGYTTEMILYEYAKQIVASGGICGTSLTHLVHGGLLELSERYNSWDNYLKPPVGDYFKEAVATRWQLITPPPGREPRVLFQVGGNVFRRSRATKHLMNTLLPKLKLIVTVDWRMSATGLYSDYILPACGWYERTSTNPWACPPSPFLHIIHKTP